MGGIAACPSATEKRSREPRTRIDGVVWQKRKKYEVLGNLSPVLVLCGIPRVPCARYLWVQLGGMGSLREQPEQREKGERSSPNVARPTPRRAERASTQASLELPFT